MTRSDVRVLSLERLGEGRGRAAAVRVWLALWSHVKWRRKVAEAWPGDKRLAAVTGLDGREVQRALLLLEASGLIARRWGLPFGARKVRRIITLAPGVARDRNPRIKIPDLAAPLLAELLGGDGKRPSMTIGLFWAIYACAQANGGDTAHVTMAALQRMTGSRSPGAFYERLGKLAEAGLVERVGDSWTEGIRVLMFVPGVIEVEARAGSQAIKLPPGSATVDGGRVIAMALTERVRPPPPARLLRVRGDRPPPAPFEADYDPADWVAV